MQIPGESGQRTPLVSRFLEGLSGPKCGGQRVGGKHAREGALGPGRWGERGAGC